MVKYSEIHKSIVRRIKKKYPNTVFSTDIEKNIERPSFYIDFDNIKSSNFMNEAEDKNLTVRIYYFSTIKNGNKMELLKAQDDLSELLLEDNLIEINDHMKFEIDELEFDTVDKVLHCYFDVRISQNYTRVDDVQLMEELNVNNILKE